MAILQEEDEFVLNKAKGTRSGMTIRTKRRELEREKHKRIVRLHLLYDILRKGVVTLYLNFVPNIAINV